MKEEEQLMQDKEVLFPENIYSKHLATINGVKFTRREIDVMACLLSARGTSKIASLLSIALRTVVAHVRNIMLKLECNSREGIIDFIERSHELSFLREYYAALTTEIAFEKSLKEVSKLKHEDSPHGLVIYWEDENQKQILLTHLDRHLCLAGFKIEIREYTGANKAEIPQDFEPILVSLAKRDLCTSCPDLENLNSLDLTELSNYYFAVFEVLKKLLPKSELSRIFSTFQEHSGSLRDLSKREMIWERVPEKSESKETSSLDKIPQIFQSRKRHIVAGIICVSFLIMGYWIMRGKEGQRVTANSHQAASPTKDDSIRSDLIIPTEAVLLNRPELITEIDNKLKNQHGIQTVALLGPGGAGKTTLARQYAHEQKAPVVWEFNAETLESLRSSFESLATVLAKTEEDKKILREIQGIKNPEAKEEKIIQFVKEWLKFRSNWVLIYDNVEKFSDIQKQFPQDAATWGNGRIILTTRDNNIQNNKQINNIIQIGELGTDQKFNFFTKILNHGNAHSLTYAQIEERKTFLESIPPFPLDISMAAYYLKATNISYGVYLDSIIKYDKNFESIQQNILKEAGSYTKTRYNIITLSLKHFINTHKDFSELLLLTSLLDSQNIPRDLLDVYKNKVIVDNFIYHLKKYSLITNPISHSGFSIHRNTQEIILTYLAMALNLEKKPQLIQNVANTLNKYAATLIETEDISKMKLLTSHCERLLTHKNLFIVSNQGAIEGELGCIYYYLSDYTKAQKILEDALVKLNKSNRKYHDKIAYVLMHLGAICRRLSNYKKAEELLGYSLINYKKYFPNNHADIARALSYLGNVYRDLGNYEKAINILEHSLNIYKMHFPQNYNDLGRVLTLLGCVYRNFGNYEKAKEIIECSLAIYKQHFPENHFRIGWASTMLGSIYRELGDYKKAKEILENALMNYKKKLPDDNIDVAWTSTHLGSVYRELGNYKKAKEILEQSLKYYKHHVSENHIDIAWVSAHLGNVFKDLGDYNKAKHLLETSLMAYQKELGIDHVETAWVLGGLGKVYLLDAQFETAESLLNKALKVFQQNKHPNSYSCFESLAEIYMKKSLEEFNRKNSKKAKIFKKKAINYLIQSLGVVKVHFPKDSPHIARIEAKLKKLEEELSIKDKG